MAFMTAELTLVQIDERGRASLGRLHPAAGRYLGEVQADGAVILHPATVMTAAQARLLGRVDVMEAVDRLVADASAGIRHGRSTSSAPP